MSGVDDLFSSDEAAPVPDRLGRAKGLLVAAEVLLWLGFTCFTGVPGTVLALFGWQLAEEEARRIAAGALPADRAPRADTVRRRASRVLFLALITLLIQLVLFARGTYEQAASLIYTWITGVEIQVLPPQP